MGDLNEFPFRYRMFLRAYRWRRIEPVPWATLAKSLRECRVALVTTAAFVLPDQEPFDESVRGGDWSYRMIPGEVDTSTLRETQRSESFDHSGIRADPNLAFPLDRLRELTGDGAIRDVAPRHLSFMGSITAPIRLIRRSAPEAAALLVDDEVDVALLVPV